MRKETLFFLVFDQFVPTHTVTFVSPSHSNSWLDRFAIRVKEVDGIVLLPVLLIRVRGYESSLYLSLYFLNRDISSIY